MYKKEGELKKAIHEATVTHEMRKIEVENLTDEVDKLNTKEQEMQEERKISELKNQDLIKSLKAKEELDEKRIQQKL